MRKKSNRRLKREADAKLMIALALPNSEGSTIERIKSLNMTKEQIRRIAKSQRQQRDQSSLTAPRQWVNHCDGGNVDKDYSSLQLGYRRTTAFDGHRLTSDNKTKLDQRPRNRRKVTLGNPKPDNKLTLQQFNLIFGSNLA